MKKRTLASEARRHNMTVQEYKRFVDLKHHQQTLFHVEQSIVPRGTFENFKN